MTCNSCVQSSSLAGLIIHGFTRSDPHSKERIARDIMKHAERRPNSTVAGKLANLAHQRPPQHFVVNVFMQMRANPILWCLETKSSLALHVIHVNHVYHVNHEIQVIHVYTCITFFT